MLIFKIIRIYLECHLSPANSSLNLCLHIDLFHYNHSDKPPTLDYTKWRFQNKIASLQQPS